MLAAVVDAVGEQDDDLALDLIAGRIVFAPVIGRLETCCGQGQAVADGSAVLMAFGAAYQLNLFAEIGQGAVGQGQGADGFGKTGKGHHADKVAGTATQILAVAQDKVVKGLFDRR